MNEDTSPAASLLRLTAFLGTAAVLLWHSMGVTQLQPRQAAGFIVLLLAAVSAGFMLMTVLADESDDLLRHTDLLVPLGLLITAGATFNVLAMLPIAATLLSASWPLTFLTISFAVSVSLIFMLLLSAVYVGWTTVLIFQLVVRGKTNLLEALRIIRLWFWRVLALELFGWSVVFGFSVIVFSTGLLSISISLIILSIASLLWNLTTAALLPVALADPRPFRQALRHGMEVSLTGMSRWASLVVVQMLLLGWITLVHVSYTTRENRHSDTTDSVTTTQQTTTNWAVNSFWTGGYADSCKWHENFMKALDASPLPLVDTLLTLLFALLAIVIKYRIINDVYRPRSVSGMESILECASGERELCDAEVSHTARVFDRT